ncbi:MAG TPA: cache domain-containing protein [Anaerolineales bacterium]|nr:cache domain-containing protein [Anaerolineales bacterium]
MTNNKPSIFPIWLHSLWGKIAVFFSLYVLVYFSWVIFHWGGEENVVLIGDLFYLPLDIISVIAAWRVTTQKELDPRIRRVWLLLGIALFSFFIGDVIWTYLENVLEVPPFPALSDLFYLLFPLLATVSLFAIPSAPLDRRERWEYILDMLIIMVTTSMLMWHFLIQPTSASSAGNLLAQAIAVAYPISDVIVIAGMIGTLLRQPDRDTRSVLWLLVTGMLFFVGADITFGYASLAGTYATGSWIDAGFNVAHLFFLFAALRQAYRSPVELPESQLMLALDRITRMLPNLTVIVGGILAISVAIINFGTEAGVLIVGTILIVILLMLKQFTQPKIQSRLTAFILIATLPLLVGVTAYLSSTAGAEIELHVNRDLQEDTDTLATNVSTWLELHARTLQQIALLPDIISMDASRQRPVLQAIAAAHPNLFLVQTTNLSGFNVARNDDSELRDYHDRAWFTEAVSGAPTTFEVLISRTTGKPALNMSAPIRNGSGQIVGVVSIVSELDEISEEVIEVEAGRGILFIVDINNRVVAHPDSAYTENELRDLSTYAPVAALREGQTGQITFSDENGKTWRAYVSTLDNGWGIISQQPEAEVLAPVYRFQRAAFTLIAVGTISMIAVAWLTIRRTLQPLGMLTDAVSALAAGDLSRVAEVKSQDEIGILAATFNNMTSQLRNLIGSLEQRVADRTKALATSSEVSRRLSTILNERQLIVEVVEQVRTAFDYYHVHIYLLDESTGELVMAGGTGDVGAAMLGGGHRISRGKGLVGRAAETNVPVLVSDTSQDPDWLPNPLLPETRSEAAVPIAVTDKILGVLDVQHNITDGLKQEDIDLLQSIAAQVAIGIQNARSYAEARERADREARITNIGQKIQGTTTVESALQVTVRELGRSLGMNNIRVILDASGLGEHGRKTS